MSTFKYDAEYFRRRRRAQGIPERDPFSAAKFVKRGRELRRLEQLSWPRNLFGEHATLAELVAEAGVQLSGKDGDSPTHVCPCGCWRKHKNNVSQTIRNPYGRGFEVIYFWSNACKSKWNRQRAEADARNG